MSDNRVLLGVACGVIAAFMTMPVHVNAGTIPPPLTGVVTVRWTFATNNIDGTRLTDLAGAKVYYGAASSNYTRIVDVPGGQPGQACTFTVTGLVAGVTYYFNGTAYNRAGLESDFCREVAKIAVEIALPSVVVDNANGVAEVKAVGSWVTSTWAPKAWGANYLHDNNNGKGTKSVTFRPTLPSDGTYSVYMWWPVQQPQYPWADNVPVDLVGSTGTVTVRVNEKIGGGDWVLIGSTTFAAGTGGYVRVRNDVTTGYVIADSVRFSAFITPPNQAPTVHAGSAPDAQNEVACSLSGSATDDGLPVGSTLTVTWSKVSGPGTVIFGNCHATNSTITFSDPGVFTLRLTATDGDKTASNDVTCDVKYQPFHRPRIVH